MKYNIFEKSLWTLIISLGCIFIAGCSLNDNDNPLNEALRVIKEIPKTFVRGTANTVKKKITGQTDNSFTDPRDGKTYKTVKIGDQVWMAENLYYDAGEGSWCYDNNSSNCNQYGRLYDWKTAKKAVPPGWHLPSKEEFETLLKNLGGIGENAYKQIIPGGSSGFNALFGGYRSNDGYFDIMGSYANFWSATEYGNDYAWRCCVCSDHQRANLNYGYNIEYYGFSVRLVKDN